MRKYSKIIILIIAFSLVFTISCHASDVIEINQLIENATALDTTEVTIQGELIGEALERGDYAWININDNSNAIGVWVERSNISQIQFYGDYKHKGDTVKITGTFYNACPEHGGDVDIHCSNIEIIQNGYIVNEKLSYIKVIIAAVLITIAILIIAIYFKIIIKKEKKRL